MNSVKQVRTFPLKKLTSSTRGAVVPLKSRSLGCVHLAVKDEVIPSDISEFFFTRPVVERDLEQVVQLKSPTGLKDLMGTDKYFAETRGSQITVIAATRKLLSEEKLRQTLKCINTPLTEIVREHWRWKPSSRRSICPLTNEEL